MPELLEVTVTEAPPGGVLDGGLTSQVGGVGSVGCGDHVTVQLRSTEPLKPLTAPSVMFAAVVPPGSMAPGLGKGAISSVKSGACAEVTGTARKPNARKIRTRTPRRTVTEFKVDFDDSDFNMSGFQFK